MRWLRHLSGRLPLRSAFLLFFIPATVLSVSLTAFASYKASVQVVSAQSKVLMGDTARQSARVVESSLRAVLTQMIALRYDPSFLSALEGELSPEPAVQRYEEIIGIRHRMEDIDATYSSLVESIFVRTGSGREFYYVPDQGPSGWSLDLDAWLRRDEANASGFGWLLAHDEDIFRTWEKRRVFSLFLRIGTPDTRLKAVAVFNLKESFFQDIFKGVDLSEHGYIVMLDRRGQPWYAREPAPGFALDPASVAALGRRDANAALRGAGGGKLLAASAQVPTSGWTLAVVVPERDFSRAMDRIEWISLGIMALMISVTSAFAVFFSASLTSPIRYLSGQTDRFVRGDLDTPFSLPDENEIGRLSRGLDSMATSVRSLLDQVKRDEDQRRAMELAVLQAQIQPHFVANTLSSVRHLVQLKDTERADEMLGALSRYFRNGLAGGRELVPLSQELEHTRDYLRIQKLRYDEAFSYEMEPLPSGLDPELPKITLQPLVENSLYHGIKDNGVFGTIRISVRTEGSCAVVEVRDDGAGMEAGRLEALRAGMDALEPGLGDAFGLRNVHQRLRRHFGPAAGLEVLSEPGNGTRVLVRLPLAPRGEGRA